MNQEQFELGFFKAATELGIDEYCFRGFMSILKQAAPFGLPDMPQPEVHMPTAPNISVPALTPNPLVPSDEEKQQAYQGAPKPTVPSSLPSPPQPIEQPKAPKPPTGAFGGAPLGNGGMNFGFPKA